MTGMVPLQVAVVAPSIGIGSPEQRLALQSHTRDAAVLELSYCFLSNQLLT